ncbi:DUF2273 domain-containing protein [Sporohalobacter salinus]|uniref:DUF2273 domain-containing protein n=1 Tax=Sporohalobacter salinus TaxID=1494606 RepID=UPI00196071AC|nr:DUF2273 domain-containing protein [Sporohalobacter salinus]MBM7622761.1 putative membrane protein [Sporohalobacter salinus]
MTNELFERIIELFYTYKGRIFGVFLGFLFSLFFIYFGFILTVFIFICIFVGYHIGSRYDQGNNFQDIIDDILPPNR